MVHVPGDCSAELLRVIASLRSSATARSVLLLRDPGSTATATTIAPAPCSGGSISGRRRVRPRLEVASAASKPTVPKKPVGDEKVAAQDVPEVPHGCETVPNGGYLGRKEMFSLLTQSEGKSKARETSDQSQSISNGIGSKPVRSPTYVRTVARPLPGSRLSVAGTVNPLDSPEKQDSPASVVHDVKPNASFLWRSNQTAKLTTVSSTDVYRTEGDNGKQATSNEQQNVKPEEFTYDDVGRPYSPVYDDVGPGSGRRAESENSSEADGSGYEECCMEKGQMSGGQGDNHIEEDIYDDVDVCTLTAQSDFECYESICGGSSCDQSNSLYGVASTIIAEDSSGSGNSNVAPRSETSDEWVDIEQSDCDTTASTPTILLVQDRMRTRRSPSWSHQVRQTWNKSLSQNRLSQQENVNSDGVCISSPSLIYLGGASCLPAGNREPPARGPAPVNARLVLWVGGTRECQELVAFLDREGEENSSGSDTDHHYEMLDDIVAKNNLNNNEIPFDDFDSFDSDESDDTYIRSLEKIETNGIHRRLPAPPPQQNVYGITKIAEAAGKKMLKLRKSFGRMKSAKRSAAQLSPSGGQTPLATPAATVAIPLVEPLPAATTASPPQPPESRLQREAPQPDSGSRDPARSRKYWSLRKFRRTTSVVSASQASVATSIANSRKTSSTFYLATGGEASKDDDSSTGKEYDGMTGGPDRRASSPAVTSQPQPAGSVLRPSEPPPLPPTAAPAPAPAPVAASQVLTAVSRRPNKKDKKEKTGGSTSWYAECGLFDGATEADDKAGSRRSAAVAGGGSGSGSSWYAEAGLWGSLTSSPNSSDTSEQDNSGQGTVSAVTETSVPDTSRENGEENQTCFRDEPLYQFYNADAVERYMRGGSEMDSDGYEEVGQGQHPDSTSTSVVVKRPSAMELICPQEGQRTLWCQIPEVVNSAVLSTLSSQQKRLQEAKFEIITSEASYMNSLNVLEKHFMSSPELCDESVLSKNDRRVLFGNVMPVKNCSEKFLSELEHCWQDDVLLQGICDIVYKHATGHFNIYIKYCSNQIYLDRTLRTLKEQHGKFAEALKKLESSPGCQMLTLHSFLMLPMQRITRLPLLVDAVLAKLDPEDSEYRSCEIALAALNKVVHECNEGARRMERMEEILILSRQLEFGRDVRPLPIISSSRWLVRSGEVTQLVWRGDDKLTFGKRLGKIPLHLFLFTDLLIVTKKKSEETYTVLDYCPRNLVQMASAETVSHLPVKYGADAGRNLILLTMLQNYENKMTEMVLSCGLESDRQRWLEAVAEPQSDNPDETVYEEWDCPQVRAVHAYAARQPDELSLDVADVVNVLRKVADGWYQGERIRDGERGWFPANHTVEIASAHIRAKNLKQRYRLLALSANFLESQRKQK
ncbi:rho guanine nucleotide exchange factor 26-like isoform X3 [Schistocerca gregaria]|uniref:rho guanine nucleotide exchange factor 26-like isoform X3 n=1 Tax=Schistocerca gregaria TaxID=7010 RepID=UPI00211E24C3|nr:rho guanine nucleotide exchange factor 26-like isoform X3 [Schistocerca gregaria]